jgi:DNA-directed RNA polymerase specialized sigma24 family protein
MRAVADEVAETSVDGLDIARALALLPAGQRQVVVLHHLLDLPVEESARALGVPVGTLKSRLPRSASACSAAARGETRLCLNCTTCSRVRRVARRQCRALRSTQ